MTTFRGGPPNSPKRIDEAVRFPSEEKGKRLCLRKDMDILFVVVVVFFSPYFLAGGSVIRPSQDKWKNVSEGKWDGLLDEKRPRICNKHLMGPRGRLPARDRQAAKAAEASQNSCNIHPRCSTTLFSAPRIEPIEPQRRNPPASNAHDVPRIKCRLSHRKVSPIKIIIYDLSDPF